MQRRKGIVGHWERLVKGKQLFRVHSGSFGVISEQRAVGVWCVCKRIDETAKLGPLEQQGETEPCHYLEMTYTSLPYDHPIHPPLTE